jgi:hypothetical protein
MTSTVIMAGCLLAASPPSADAPVAAPPIVAAPTIAAPLTSSDASVWYGQRAAIVDTASIAALGTGVFLVGRSSAGGTSALVPPLILGGLGVFVFGGPVLHLSNEHPGRAAASLALRLLGSFTSLYLLVANDAGSCNADNGTDHPGCDKLSFPQLVRISVPILVAAALDDLILARGTVPAHLSKERSVAWIAPSAASGSLSLTVGGFF